MSRSAAATGTAATVLLVAGGVLAGTHIWKLSGALFAIEGDVPMSLLQAGFLIAVIQAASIVGGLPTAWLATIVGAKRLACLGLLLLAAGSAAGSMSVTFETLLIARGVEGVGFLLYTVLAPGLISQHAPAAVRSFAIAGWATFQGIAAFIGLALTPMAAHGLSWRTWWIVLGAVTIALMIAAAVAVPRDAPDTARTRQPSRTLTRTLSHRSTWIAGVVFACYSAPWLAVLGFLPTVLGAGDDADPIRLGILAGLVGLANAVGALIGARLVHAARRASRVLAVCFAGMVVTAMAGFLVADAVGGGPAWLIGCLTLFSGFGGVIPAVLTRLAVEITPVGSTPATTFGLMQQVFNVGNLAGPPLLAWVVVAAGGWQSAGFVVAAFACGGLLCVWMLRDPLAMISRAVPARR